MFSLLNRGIKRTATLLRLSAAGLLLMVAGCTIAELPARLEAVEREQSTLGDSVAGLGESVSELTSRYVALDSEMNALAERQDKVDAWIRRLGGRTGTAAPRPVGRPVNAAPQPAVPRRQLVRAANEKVIFENGSSQRVMVRATPGPGLSPDAQVEMRIVAVADTSSGVPGGLTASGRYSVPCGSRLVATADADLLLFVEAENAGPC